MRPLEGTTVESRPSGEYLPGWATSDIPEPPPPTPRNVLRVIGPGAVLLAFSIGAGEWLLAPAVLATYGVTILWIASGSIVLQALLNTEMARYTLYTGEPIFTGFMRTAPGPKFWGWVYTGLHFLQVSWPGWALAAATAVAALFLGRVPHEGDRMMVLYLGYVTFLIASLLVLIGETVGKTLEQVEIFMICWILGFLTLTGLVLIPSGVWLTVGAGFVGPLLAEPPLPASVDWFLVAGFAAYSGAGGTINAGLTCWLRDKGLGMSGTVVYLPAVVGGQKIQVSTAGAVFPPSEDNLRKWKKWWRYLRTDQWCIWVPGAIIGMGLPALIAVAFIEHQTSLGGYGIAAYLAEALGMRFGPSLWVLALLTGFWILFSTQLANAEGCARLSTELLGTASGRRGWQGAELHTVYYRALLAFTLWGCVALALTDPLTLILVGANVAAANLVLLSIHTLVVNRKFLPHGVRPSVLRELGLVLSALFFGGLALLALTQRLGLAGS